MTFNSVNYSKINAGHLYDVWIEGYSRVGIYFDTADLTLGEGETLDRFTVRCNGHDFTPNQLNNVVTGALLRGDNTVVCTAYGFDADGNEINAVYSFTINAYAYTPPTATYIAERTDDEGVPDVEGGYIKITASVNCSEMGGANSVITDVYMRNRGSSGWVPQDRIWGNGSVIIGGSLTSDRSYDLLYSFSDTVGSTGEVTDTVYSQFWSMRFSDDGHGVSFGLSSAESRKLTLAQGMSLKMGNTVMTEAQLAALLAGVTVPPGRTLLWTNPDETASFAAQTLSLNLSGYDRIVLLMKNANNAAIYSLNEAVVGGGQFAAVSSNFASTSYIYKRGVTATIAGVDFTNGYRNTSANASYMLPVKIWGVTD